MTGRVVAAVAVGALLLGACVDGAGPESTGDHTIVDQGLGDARPEPLVTADAPTPTPTPTPTPSATPTPTPPATPTPSPSGSSTAVRSEVPLRIEVRTSDAATSGFAQQAASILTDRRGWSRAGFDFTFAESDAPYRLVLAEGDGVDELCKPYDTYGKYSCQNGPVVAINADRWRAATPSWTGSLDEYRTMLVNHEIGHLLHLHHPRPQCPGQGWPAPVMMQQSTELGACTANPWPLPWEIDLAAQRREPLAPPAEHDVSDHRPAPPKQRQDTDHRPD